MRFSRSQRAILEGICTAHSNVAEGHSRHSTPHYVQHLWTAHASGAELETQPEIGARVEIIAPQEAQMLIDDAQEIGRMINGLVKSLERGEHVRSEEVSDRAR